MKMEFSCQDHVHFLRFSVLHRCIVGRVLLSLILGALYFGSFGKSTVYFLALRVLGGGSSVPVLFWSPAIVWQIDSSFFGSASSRRRQLCPRSVHNQYLCLGN